MTMGEFKPLLLSKSVGRTELPPDADLKERIHTALKRIAKDTLPLKLTKNVPTGTLVTFSVIRKIDSNTYVRFPIKPVDDEADMDMDAELMDATALYIMAGLERANARTYMGLYYTEIELNNDRLTETELTDADNDCADRFMVFP